MSSQVAQHADVQKKLARVGVVIPTYNSEEFVCAAIRSVLEQTWGEIEIVVVDDGSTDQTLNVLRRFENKGLPLRVYHKENGGASSARNFGCRLISQEAKYVFFLDADDKLRPDALRRMVSYMEEHPEVGLLGCQFNYIDYDSDQIVYARRTRYCKPGLFPRDLRDDEVETPFEVFFCGTGQGPFALYRRRIFDQTAGWSEDLWGHNDTDMFIQMALEAPVHYLPDVLYLKKKVRTSLEHRPGRHGLYSLLRYKWDNFVVDDRRKKALLANARLYYVRWHLPFRNFKVGMKATKEFLRHPSFSRALWVWELLYSGASTFVLSRLS